MSSHKQPISLLILLLLSTVIVPGVVIAEQIESEEDQGASISFSGVTDAVHDLIDDFSSFTDDLDEILIDVGLTLLVLPFKLLAESIEVLLTYLFVSYPDVRHPDVISVHNLVYRLTLLLAVPALIWLGFEHILGRRDGIRPTIKLISILVIGGLAPWLLFYPIEISRLTSLALLSESTPIIGTLNIALMTAVVIWLKAIILVTLALLFIIRDFYLLFYTAAFPLIILLTYFRPTRQHMAPLTGLFIGCLLIAPFNLIAYQLVIALVDINAASPVPHYLLGIGGYFVLLALPYIILSNGISMALPAMMVTQAGSERVSNHVKSWREQNPNLKRQARQRIDRAVPNRFRNDTVDVNLNHRSPNEVELQYQRTIGNTAGRLHGRFLDEDQVRVEVKQEDDWWQDYGFKPDWVDDEAELKERDDQ